MMKRAAIATLIVFLVSLGLLAAIPRLRSNVTNIVHTRFLASAQESVKLRKMDNPNIVVKKAERTLEVFDGEKLIATYEIALGFEPIGDKEIEGDGKTPEGEFYVFTKNPKSRFYLSLGVSYPNKEDAIRGLKAELITKSQHDSIVRAIATKETPLQKTSLGGEIYIHGNGNGADWTAGCIAMKNADINELFGSVPEKTRVVIKP